MRLFGNVLFWIVLALLGALAAQWLLNQPGQVIVRWQGSDYSTTLALAIAGLLGVLFVAVLLWKLLTFPVRAWRERSGRRGRARLGEGLDALHAGQYERAEKLLTQASDDPDVAASARLAAARAALRRGDPAAARAQIAALDERHAAARAIALAELALREHRPTDALVALDAPAAQPLPPRGLALRAEALAAAGQSSEAYGMLGSLRKQHALPSARADELQERWAAASLREAADTNTLAARWEALPKTLKTEPAVANAYAERAQALGWDDAARGALEHALDARWDERLAFRYGALPATDAATRQQRLERWLQAHPGSPAAMLGLSRTYRAQQRALEADDYLQRALAAGAGADAWEEYGDAQAAAGNDAAARAGYANALRVSRGEMPHDIPVRERRALAHEIQPGGPAGPAQAVI